MRLVTIICFVLMLLGTIDFSYAQSSPYTWICEEKRCLRKLKDANNEATGVPMNICKLNCDDVGSLWPKPTGKVALGKDLVSFNPSSISINLNDTPAGIKDMLNESFSIFQGYLTMMHSGNNSGNATVNRLVIEINVTSDKTELDLSTTDESYSLTVSSSEATLVTAKISGITFFGARHALETLSQLIAYDNVLEEFRIVSNVTIEDKPVFPYRAIMLDTSRNFFSIEMLERLIVGMSYNKLSVFHWHIIDSYAFPMSIPRRPQMTEYGAYSPEKIYTVDDIKHLVKFAKQRGIKVVPELDQPAHSGYGYNWGPKENLGDLVVCVESEPWHDFCVQPPCGQLNIVNENVTTVIGDIFEDMLAMFDNDVFHMGGDEVDFRCYNSTKQITDWMVSNNYSLSSDGFFRLWGEFQETALQKLLKASTTNDTKILLWTSGLTHPDRIEQYLDKDRYIIQIWTASDDPIIHGVLQKGYKVVFANVDALYLDCGFPAWLGNGHNWCAPIKGWQTIYDNDPEAIYARFANDSIADEAIKSGQIMGSVTPLWAEQADENALESRIWPRAAAHAERLWTHPKTSHSVAEYRMVTNRNRMSDRGIKADRLQPEFCLQFEGKCYAPPPTPGGGDSGVNPLYSSLTILTICLSSILLF